MRALLPRCAIGVAIGLFAAACAAPSVALPAATGHAGVAAPSAFPLTVIDDMGGAVRVESADRIIPVDGDIAEIVFALGLGADVVATDLSATYPAEADAKPEIGYQRALSAESIAAFDPTIVLATRLAGPPSALDDLRRLGYSVVVVPNEATPEGPGEKIRAIADALGVSAVGRELAASVNAEIEVARVAPDSDPPTVLALYVRGGAAQLVLGVATPTHWLIEAAGGVDLAAEIGVDDTAPISAEAILAADPDAVLVTRTGLESVGGIDGLLEIGALDRTRAGRNGNIFAFDDQLLLGNGPRVAHVIVELATELKKIQEDQ